MAAGVEEGLAHQVLLGVTGSGRTYAMVCVFFRVDRPTLVIRPHKTLAAQVYMGLQVLFPKLDVSQVEVEIANEVKKNVKGHRRSSGIAEWMENAFFEFHCSLYKGRPILWHIASGQRTAPFGFGALMLY